MKSILIALVSLPLIACMSTVPDNAKAARRADAKQTAECRRSPYCGTYTPGGKPDSQIEAELRDVREAVERSKD